MKLAVFIIESQINEFLLNDKKQLFFEIRM